MQDGPPYFMSRWGIMIISLGCQMQEIFTGRLPKILRPLFDLIIDAFDGSSEIACFPKKFSTEFAPRFIGIQPENSVQLISEFMANESLGSPSVDAGSAVAE